MVKSGESLLPNQILCINRKPINTLVDSFDLEEGWVDILVPELPKNIVKATKATAPAIENEEDLPEFEYVVKRLTGKIEIAVLLDE